MARRYYSSEQMRDAARRRLPRFAFDFIDGGAGREFTVQENQAAIARLRLVPRVLRGTDAVSLKTTIFGQTYEAPFGVAPMGLPAVAWPGADLGLARTAARGNIPCALSTAASDTIERVAAVAPGVTWFQLYHNPNPEQTQRLLDRVAGAGVSVLLLTVDRPVMGWRVRDLTNAVGLPFKPALRNALDLLRHPQWTIATLRAGAPRLAHAEPVPSPTADLPAVPLDWAYLSELRTRWTGTLVVKGVLHPADARCAIELGADGVVVSNHGGAHLESAAASIERIGAVRDAIGKSASLLFDGGVRSGEDIAKAIALGADFVLLGRAFAYAVAALGPDEGPRQTLDILRQQLLRTLPLLGCGNIMDLHPGHVAAPTAVHA